METPIDTLTVQAHATTEVAADHADLTVTLRGSSLITGNAALKQAREVRQLVSELAQVGIPESAITLLSVVAETSSNAIGRSSSANYQLRVRVAQLDDLADALGVVSSQKQSQLNHISWGYPDLEPIYDTLLEQSLKRAATKAEIMASALGCVLTGVHQANENTHSNESEPFRPMVAPMAAQGVARSRVSSEELGMNVSHTKRITTQVNVIYRIRPV